VLALLASSGIVEAKEGRDGGYSLKIPADKLTLADVYMAVRLECTDSEERGESMDCGEAGKQLDSVLETIMNEAEQQTVEFLKGYTLKDLMENVDFSSVRK
jgi:Rrf2 family protein